MSTRFQHGKTVFKVCSWCQPQHMHAKSHRQHVFLPLLKYIVFLKYCLNSLFLFICHTPNMKRVFAQWKISEKCSKIWQTFEIRLQLHCFFRVTSILNMNLRWMMDVQCTYRVHLKNNMTAIFHKVV